MRSFANNITNDRAFGVRQDRNVVCGSAMRSPIATKRSLLERYALRAAAGLEAALGRCLKTADAVVMHLERLGSGTSWPQACRQPVGRVAPRSGGRS